MGRPNHGVLGLSFLGTRGLQSVSLIICISLAAKFISSMVEDQQAPPQALVGVLCVFCIATLYCAASLILYFDNQLPLFESAVADVMIFVALMTSSIVIGKPLSYLSCKAVAKGSTEELVQNLGAKINQEPDHIATITSTPLAQTAPTQTFAADVVQYTATTVSNAAATVAATLAPGGNTQVKGSDGNFYTISGRSLTPRDLVIKESDYKSWITGGSPSECMMMKAVWGFGITMTVLFVFSATMLAFIWKSQRPGRSNASKTADDA